MLHYEPHAFLRDRELVHSLLMLLSGIGTVDISFSLDIVRSPFTAMFMDLDLAYSN
jgi:hypothetical protein